MLPTAQWCAAALGDGLKDDSSCAPIGAKMGLSGAGRGYSNAALAQGVRWLREPDVFAARPLRSLTALEGDRLSLVKLVESDLRASRIVKEVLGSVK